MSISKRTQTLTAQINPVFGEGFEVAAILPLERPKSKERNRIPISLHISKVGNKTVLGCYVYTIIDAKTGKIYQTLLNNSEEHLVDMSKKIGGLVAKKFSVPTYISMSGDWSLEDLISTAKEIIKFIDESF